MSEINRTEYAILGLLAMGARTGYDIKKRVEETLGHFWHESFGHLYPMLQRLHERGWVTKTPEVVGGRRRNAYALTEAGRAAFQEWFREPIAPVPLRNELLLRLFFGHYADPHDLLALVRQHRARIKAGLAQLEAMQQLVPAEAGAEAGPHLPYWLLTMRMGYHVTKGLLAWSDEALAALQPPTDEDPDATT